MVYECIIPSDGMYEMVKICNYFIKKSQHNNIDVRRLERFPKPIGHSSNSVSSMHALRAIAAFKLFKAVLLCSLGFGVFRLLNPVVEHTLTHWVGSFAWSYNRGLMLSALTKITGLPRIQLKTLGIGVFLYAILFFIEGVGLWAGRRWAEYLTIIATGSLIPVEVYELFRRTTIPRGLALLINLVVVVYLVRVVRRQAASRKLNLAVEPFNPNGPQ
jgi:uncharacterized membrane protein (DUF2068 family)